MSIVWKILPWVVVSVLVAAGGIFALRAWVGTDPASDSQAKPGVVTSASPTTVEPSPTPSESASPEPAATSTPKPKKSTKPKKTTAPKATARPQVVGTRSTAAVARQIKASLDRKGRATSVGCPQRVSAAVGTTFRCTVAYADQPSVVVADAHVKITSARGTFSWRSQSRG